MLNFLQDNELKTLNVRVPKLSAKTDYFIDYEHERENASLLTV